MRIAFVGKGGAGKSTVATLFFLYQTEILKNRCIIFDADLNVHVPKLLGIEFPSSKLLSSTENTKKIREFFIGKSKKIKGINYFYKTTPPSKGVNLFALSLSNYIIENFTVGYKQNFIAAVGTYEKEGIGVSCYHTNLSILENILNFAELKRNEMIIVDMVAGIDAFSNTLHQQFDLITLVIEPTQESIEVYNQYLDLATHADIAKNIYVIANKIEEQEDFDFIKKYVDEKKIIGQFPKIAAIKKKRQNNIPLNKDDFKYFNIEVFEKLYSLLNKIKINPNDRLKKLHQLHLKYIKQEYVKRAVGDISYQIDEEFSYGSE
jgi:CO dehydrogenase maturation factor